MTETAIRVALADDDVLLREGLASLLERSGFVVAGQAGDGSQLIALVREHEPELAIVDIRMPPDHATEGLDAARVIRAEFPDVAILVLSAHVEVEHAMDLLARTDRPISEVAAASGFNHTEVLNRIFRREVGMTPGAYRRQFRPRAAPESDPARAARRR